MAENVVEILVTSRNKTGAGFKAAEAEAGASAGRISGIFSKMGDAIGSHLQTLGGNLGKGGGLFAGGAGLLAMAGPLGAATAALGAFGAVAIPELSKVQEAMSKTGKAGQQAMGLLTPAERGLVGPLKDLEAGFGRVAAVMAPVVDHVAALAVKTGSDLLPALGRLASAGGSVLSSFLRPLDAFVRSPAFGAFINEFAQFAVQAGALVGPQLVRLIGVFTQLFIQVMPSGMRILVILLPLLVQLTGDLVPVIAAVASVTAKVLEWLQHTHLLLPLLALLAVVILALDAPIAAIVAAVAVLIAIGVELGRNWHKIWTDIRNWAADAWNWIKGHWPLLLGILTGPFGLAVAYIGQHFGQLRHDAAALVDDIVSFFAQLPGRILGAIGNLGSEIWSHVTGGLGAIGHFLGLAAGGIVGAASGGVHGGLRLVGERGPELVRLPRGSMVYPAGQTAGMLGGGAGGGITITFAPGPSGGLEGLFWTWLKNGVRVQGGDPAMFQRKVAFS